MQVEQQILSNITIHTKYAKYLQDKQRRETWEEIVDRNKQMHLKKFKDNRVIVELIHNVYDYVLDKKILPSMRSAQFAGKAIELSPSRIYNCAFLPINDVRSFSEIMFLLLGGTGVGYSVQKHHVNKLAPVNKPTKYKRYVIQDSIIGWADSIKALIRSYLTDRDHKFEFDFNDIRAKGTPLKTSGGKAPGPEPLRKCIQHVQDILESKNNGEKLSTTEVHDIVCHIADCVLAGGIRRAALISLFDKDDESMIQAKSGAWWEDNLQRGRANNSVVLPRDTTTKEEFLSIWKQIENSGAGEPGVYFTNDINWGTNPCCEIALKPFQFCNLCEVNAATVVDQDDLNKRVLYATILGTLQASYTDFHYLRDEWKETTEKEALIGVGITGIASKTLDDLNLTEAADIAKATNKAIADKIGINAAARVTTVKPSGTSSLVLGCSSGIHAYHNDYYIRGMQLNNNEAITQYMKTFYPELIEKYEAKEDMSFLKIPIKAPEGSKIRTEETIDLLNRIKRFNLEWVKAGHRSGENTNNVSATVNIKDGEWDMVGEWMWNNRDTFNGLSVLPYDGGTYTQAPFTDCSKEEYEQMKDKLTAIDLTQVKEDADYTNLQGELACAGGACEINI